MHPVLPPKRLSARSRFALVPVIAFAMAVLIASAAVADHCDGAAYPGEGHEGETTSEMWVGAEEGAASLILNTGHNNIRPNQDCVDKPTVDSMVATLRNGGTLAAIELYSFADGVWIAQGHHRYVAAHIAGKKIKAVWRGIFSSSATQAGWRADWGGVGWC